MKMKKRDRILIEKAIDSVKKFSKRASTLWKELDEKHKKKKKLEEIVNG